MAPTTTRREFLASSVAAGAAAPLLSFRGAPRPATRKKKILIIGGTRYLGPAIVEAALAAGHELTLFNRGRTNPGLFPDVEKLKGQRRRKGTGSPVDQDLSALQGRSWDAVIDTAGYYTANLEDSSKLLKDNVDHYVFVSSVSVYSDMEKNNKTVTESSPLGTLEDKYVAKITEETYGPLKAYCEQAVETAFPGRATLVRPGYIIGPGDPFDRLTSRVLRLADGGRTLAPGRPEASIEMIDVRDLGSFVVKTVEDGLFGPFNADGYAHPVTVGEFHDTSKLAFNHDVEHVWVSDEFLEANKVVPWGDIACWTPARLQNHVDATRAVQAGMTLRPAARTMIDTFEWAMKERVGEGKPPLRAGMKPDREKKLLADWPSFRK